MWRAVLLLLALIVGAHLTLGGWATTNSSSISTPNDAPRLSPFFAATGLAAVVQNERSLLLSDASGTFRSSALAPEGGYLEDPAWRPDGKTVAFTRYVSLDAATSGQTPLHLRFGSDIWQVDPVGTARLLVQGDDPTARLSQPAWAPDGATIFFVREYFFEAGGIKGLRHEIDRVDLATGQRSAIVDDGYSPSVSPDGKLLAFVNLADSGRTDLWVLDLATGQQRRVTDGRFSSLSSPQFSHDSQTIAFGGAESRAAVLSLTDRSSDILSPLFAWIAPIASAHELLDGLWLIGVDGMRMRPVGSYKFDNPTIRWTAEPNHILLYDEDGLYQIDIFARQRQVIFQPGGYRGFDWLATD